MSNALVLLLCSLFLQPCVLAQPGERGQGNSRQDQNTEQEEETGTAIDRRRASELARASFEGRVLNVRLVEGVWRVRMDNEGTVFDVSVHATTGKVSRPE